MDQLQSWKKFWILHAAITGLMCAFIISVSYGLLPFHFDRVLEAPESDYLFYGLLAFASINSVVILFFFDSLAESVKTVNDGSIKSATEVRKGRFFAKVAMSEAISIYGLVYFMVVGSVWQSLLFCAISFFLLLRLYPSDESVETSS